MYKAPPPKYATGSNNTELVVIRAALSEVRQLTETKTVNNGHRHSVRWGRFTHSHSSEVATELHR